MPKAEIRPDPVAIRRVLNAGWVGQLRTVGHRAQIHISADPDAEVIAYTRQGTLHKRALPGALVAELRRLFAPTEGWNAIEAEWWKVPDLVFVSDFVKRHGDVLSRLTFRERHALLPRVYRSPHVRTAPLYRSVEKCLAALENPPDGADGLMLRAAGSAGFEDTSLIRCRRL